MKLKMEGKGVLKKTEKGIFVRKTVGGKKLMGKVSWGKDVKVTQRTRNLTIN